MDELSRLNDLTVPPRGWIPFLWCCVVGHRYRIVGSYRICGRCEALSSIQSQVKDQHALLAALEESE